METATDIKPTRIFINVDKEYISYMGRFDFLSINMWLSYLYFVQGRHEYCTPLTAVPGLQLLSEYLYNSPVKDRVFSSN